MKTNRLNLNRATGDQPATIEVSTALEPMIIEALRRVTGKTSSEIRGQRIFYKEDSIAMIRFVLPELTDD